MLPSTSRPSGHWKKRSMAMPGHGHERGDLQRDDDVGDAVVEHAKAAGTDMK